MDETRSTIDLEDASRRRRRLRRLGVVLGIATLIFLALPYVSWPEWVRKEDPGNAALEAEVRRMGGEARSLGEDGNRPSMWVRNRAYHLILRGPAIGDSELGRLAKLGGERIRNLELVDTAVTDAGLIALNPESRLFALSITRSAGKPRRPGISDAGLTPLAKLRGLRTLDLSGEDIDDAGLVRLQGLTNLVILTLDRTAVRGPGLDALVDLTSLTTISLVGCPIDDDAIPHIAAHGRHMENLYLGRTGVTARGLLRLRGGNTASALRLLSIPGTAVLDKELPALRNAMPGVAIFWSAPDISTASGTPAR